LARCCTLTSSAAAAAPSTVALLTASVSSDSFSMTNPVFAPAEYLTLKSFLD